MKMRAGAGTRSVLRWAHTAGVGCSGVPVRQAAPHGTYRRATGADARRPRLAQPRPRVQTLGGASSGHCMIRICGGTSAGSQAYSAAGTGACTSHRPGRTSYRALFADWHLVVRVRSRGGRGRGRGRARRALPRVGRLLRRLEDLVRLLAPPGRRSRGRGPAHRAARPGCPSPRCKKKTLTCSWGGHPCKRGAAAAEGKHRTIRAGVSAGGLRVRLRENGDAARGCSLRVRAAAGRRASRVPAPSPNSGPLQACASRVRKAAPRAGFGGSIALAAAPCGAALIVEPCPRTTSTTTSSKVLARRTARSCSSLPRTAAPSAYLRAWAHMHTCLGPRAAACQRLYAR